MSSADGHAVDVGTLTRLWLAAIAAYGHKWTSHVGDLPVGDDGRLTVAGALWAKGLAGFRREAIMAAFEACVLTGDDWPPSLPQLRMRCFGIPSAGRVRAEITGKSLERSPFAVLVWQMIPDTYRFGMASAAEADRIFRDAYQDAVEHVMAGGELPAPVAAIAPPARREYSPPDPERVAQHQAAIAELLDRPMPAPEPRSVPAGLSPAELDAYEQELIRQRREREASAAAPVEADAEVRAE